MDFVADSLYNGRRLRILTVVDDLSKECPVLEVDHSLTGQRITRVLERAALTRGLPEVITVDNGPEFTSKALDSWAYTNGLNCALSNRGNRRRTPISKVSTANSVMSASMSMYLSVWTMLGKRLKTGAWITTRTDHIVRSTN